MQIRSLFTCFVLLILGVLSFQTDARAAEYGFFCNTCSVETDFRNYAVANTPVTAGVFTVDVANYNTNIGYRVNIEREWDQELRRYHTIVSSVAWTTTQKNGFVAAKGMFSSQTIRVDAPHGEGTESFRGSDLAAVSLVIAASPAMISVRPVSFSIWGALKALAGKFPVAYVVFPNGDVAQYDIINPAGGATCCVYKRGTARDIYGNVIDLPGSGGNYVRNGGGDGTPGNPYQQRIDTSNWLYSCAWINHADGSRTFLGCVRVQ
jgi:hypothetical protein